MDISYALTYIFEDKQWVSKIALVFIFCALSAIPLIGLLPTALLLGYLVMLAANVRDGAPRPLPRWQDYGRLLQLGAPVLLAIILYHIPLILYVLTMNIFWGQVTRGVVGSFSAFGLFCCVAPFVILYLAWAWAFLAVGMRDYLTTRRANAFYRPARQLDILRTHSRLVMNWLVAVLLVNVAATLLGAIPCLGWLAAPAFIIPVHGHLLGQFVRLLAVAPPVPVKRRA